MLLVALHAKNNFELPAERVPEWYGWSADTAERGLATLEQLGLLTHITRLKKAPLSPTGLTKVNRYLLHPPFGQYTAEDIFDGDVITAMVYPSPPKGRPDPQGDHCREGWIMTAPDARQGGPTPERPGQQGKLQEPVVASASTPRGAVPCTPPSAALSIWLLVNVLPHIHISITWR